jgi:hypothetical protein
LDSSAGCFFLDQDEQDVGGQLFAAWLASRLASLHAEVLYNNTEPVVYPSIERADAVSSLGQ